MKRSIGRPRLLLASVCWTLGCASDPPNFHESEEGPVPGSTAVDAGTTRTDGSMLGTNSSGQSPAPSSPDGPNQAGPSQPELGDECSQGADCPSGFCADGYCCDEACDGQCESCAERDSEGICVPVSGAPRGSRDVCTGEGSCQGQCDGVDGLACAYPDSSTVCEAATCSDGVVTSASVCNGAGVCTIAAAVECASGACASDDVSCDDGCDASSCGSHRFCDASGACFDKLDDGASCSSAGSCASGHCVDGVCCDTECEGLCESCTEAGSQGSCQVLIGAPLPARGECDGSGVCKGQCDGSNAGACAYPGNSTECSPAACSNGEATPAASCDAAGSCSSVTASACASGSCSGASCAGSCSASSCGSDAFCATSGACEPKKARGQSCSNGWECATGNCVDGVCCESACNGQCQVCDSSGQCGRKSSGAPTGGRAACSGVGTACEGVCDGSSDSCVYPDSATLCSNMSCSGDLREVTFMACNGAGSCSINDADACSSTTYCSDGSCRDKKANNNTCSVGAECDSGSCSTDPSSSNSLCCASGDANCGGSCTNVTSNDDHCGGCNQACGANESCSSGDCECNGVTLSCGGCGSWTFEHDNADTEGWLELAPPGSFSRDVTSVVNAPNPDKSASNGSERVLEVTLQGSSGSFSVPLCSGTPANVEGVTVTAKMYIDVTAGNFAFDSGVGLIAWNGSTTDSFHLNPQLDLGSEPAWLSIQATLDIASATHVGFSFSVPSDFAAKIYLDDVQFN